MSMCKQVVQTIDEPPSLSNVHASFFINATAVPVIMVHQCTIHSMQVMHQNKWAGALIWIFSHAIPQDYPQSNCDPILWEMWHLQVSTPYSWEFEVSQISQPRVCLWVILSAVWQCSAARYFSVCHCTTNHIRKWLICHYSIINSLAISRYAYLLQHITAAPQWCTNQIRHL